MVRRSIRALVDAGGAHRVPPAELLDSVLPDIGDTRGKSTAFWPLLVCSSIIAAVGVLSDSTAVVIGAMVIAPLGTPIYGVAAALVADVPVSRVFRRLLLGTLVAIAIGALVDLVMYDLYAVETDPQVLSRTNPSLPDLLVALATGVAGALALARRDISPALPGVAIAISLVPPLAVVGITAAHGLWELSLGALLLFATNLLAIVAASLVIFGSLGLRDAHGLSHARSTRARVVLSLVALVVFAALVTSTVHAVLVFQDEAVVQRAASEWDDEHAEWQLDDVKREGSEIVVTYLGDAEATDPSDQSELDADLRARLESDAVDVDVQFIRGERHELAG